MMYDGADTKRPPSFVAFVVLPLKVFMCKKRSSIPAVSYLTRWRASESREVLTGEP